MAVYTRLSDAHVEQLFCLYEELGAVKSVEGVDAGSINSIFKVTLENACVYVRIGEDKAFSDLMYERTLLEVLDAKSARLGGVKTPLMLRNCIGGTFFPIGGGKYAMVFAELLGRELGVFERTPDHCFEVGAFLARAHLVLRRHKGGRSNPYRQDVVRRWIDGLDRQLLDRDLAAYLRGAFAEVEAHRQRLLPRGVVHGDLFMNNTKWRRGHLDAVFDWEMAGRDHLMLDLAITALAWAWDRGDPGAFSLDDANALFRGYTSVRPLRPVEIRGAYGEFLLAAVRFCASRVRDFHLDQEQGREVGDRAFLDYREYAARIDAVRALGDRGLRALLREANASATTRSTL